MERKKTIEEIMASFQVMKNKFQMKALQTSDDSNVTHSQWFVLGIVEQNTNVGIKEISKILGISSSAATQLVDGLVENKYVERKEDPDDRRALHITITTEGQKYILEKRKEHMEKTTKLFSVLNDQELEEFLRIHKKILTNISSDTIV